MTRYQLQRRHKPGPVSDIEDSAFRSRCISFAATGMSRRGVAAALGKPEATIRGWIERGLAYPTEEPYCSFSVDYRRAERGLEGAAASTVSLTVGMLYELTKSASAGEALALEKLAKMGPQLKEILNVLAARFPQDWGTSKHREPEPDYDGQAYLDAHSMDREQLAALFADPPEVMRNALCDAGHAVYRILLAGGFDPAAPIPVDADALEE